MNASTDESNASESQDSNAGVVIPEEFQQQAHKLLSRADKHQLNHVSDRVSARREELMREEQMAEEKAQGSSKKSKKAMPEMLDATMPGSPMMNN